MTCIKPTKESIDGALAMWNDMHAAFPEQWDGFFRLVDEGYVAFNDKDKVYSTGKAGSKAPCPSCPCPLCTR
jgi:hypothetical protein